MTKFYMILVLLMAFSPAQAKEAEKFINPIFYETMEPLSTGTWRTKLTPSLMERDNKGTVLKQKCTLIDNTMDYITFDCEGPYDASDHLLYRFVLHPEDKSYNGMLVFMHYKGINEKTRGSTETFTIQDRPQ